MTENDMQQPELKDSERPSLAPPEVCRWCGHTHAEDDDCEGGWIDGYS